MIINGLTVCVNYEDRFAVGAARWRSGLDSLCVVTNSASDPQKIATLIALPQPGLGGTVYQTDAFYANGAAFNKGAAMQEAVEKALRWDGWILFFDADTVPPRDWRQKIEAWRPVPGCLYGAWRYQCERPEDVDRTDIPSIAADGIGMGFFQFFHSGDPAVQNRSPLLDTHWNHAGNYDNRFAQRWPRGRRVRLPLRLGHFGPRDEWFGRGKTEDFTRMQELRRKMGGRWDHETVPGGEIQ